MNVKFYNMSSPTIKISKTKTLVGEAPATPNPTGPINIVNPVLVIDKDRVPANANYMEIPTYGRSYFITSIDWTTANTAIVAGHSDVLSNFTPTGTMNFVRGAGTLTEMDDMSYPISDYMIEEYFPMTTWTDIFSAGGSDRQFLLRTVSGNAEEPVYVDLSAGNVFWDGTYYTRDSDQATIYNCFQFTPLGQKTFAPSYVPRQDIQGLSQVLDGYYVRTDIGGTPYVYKWDSKENIMTRM